MMAAMDIDFLGIQAFLAIMECGSFQQAATKLHLSQTAISHRMRKLEDSMKVRLITRTSREITLTDAGRQFLPRARAAMQQLAQSVEAISMSSPNANRWLAFACLPTLAVGLIQPLLSRCQQQFPDAPVRIFDSPIREIFELVESSTAAFGLTIGLAPRPGLRIDPIGTEPFVLVCPAAHAMGGRKQVCWDELRHEPLVRISLPAGNAATIDDTLGALGSQLNWRYETQRNALALEMVRAGLCLTVVPALSVVPGHGLRAIPVAQPTVTRELAMVSQSARVFNPAEEFLRTCAISLIRERLGGSQAIE